MALLASMLAYLGAATAIAVALLMATTVFLATPDQPTSTLQTLAMASRPIAPEATTNATTKPTPMIGRLEPRVPLQLLDSGTASKIKGGAYTRPRPHTANASLRKQFLHMLARQERTRRWANQQEPDFGSRYMGYVDDPSADYRLIERGSSESAVGKSSPK
jgi:hypothetical protein